MLSLLLIISLLSSSTSVTTIFAENKEYREVIQITQEDPDKQETKNSKKNNTWNYVKSIAIDTAQGAILAAAVYMYLKYQRTQYPDPEGLIARLNKSLGKSPGEDIPFLSRYFTYPGNLGEIKQQTVQTLNERFPSVLNISSEVLNDKFNTLGLNKKNDFIDHCFNEFSSKISKRDRAKAIYDWITSNINYDYNVSMSIKDNILDLFATFQKASKAEVVFSNKKGICGGISDLTFWMMRSAKVPCAIIDSLKEQSLGHAFNAIFIEDSNGQSKWALTDTTWGGDFHFPSNIIDENNVKINNEEFHNITFASSSNFGNYILNACKTKLIGIGILGEILELKYHFEKKIKNKIVSNVIEIYKMLTGKEKVKNLSKK